ncbi:MAG: cellulose 1,4-beta-cellobiosidase, partial [Actinomycetales bacterium]|nr:cellulose 1,4-beta-cellobiosidase [Actinomycetales bacterium]
WSLTFTFPSGQTITQGWVGKFSQSGSRVTVTNEAWNGSLGSGQSTSPGFIGNWNGSNAAPTDFAVNGTACNGGGGQSTTTTTTTTTTRTTPTTTTTRTTPTTTTTTTRTTPTTTTTTRTTPTTTTRTTTTSGGGGNEGSHVDNPYASVKMYVNPEWSAKAAAEPGGSRVANQPTAVWLDRIAAIEGTTESSSNGAMGLRDHLDEALAQGAGAIQIVIYDLPGRDCAALASNGELGPTEIDRYKSEYIDPIAAIQGDAKYNSLRIINIIEIDSLPNLITNAGGTAGSTDACATMKANGNYVNGIAYALGTLRNVGGNNIYNYVDAAHHGWIGWDTNFNPSSQLFASTADKATGTVSGKATVDGFIVNTANYSALQEPYFTINTTVGGQSVRQSKWVDWNFYVDELSFAQAFRQRLVSDGFASNIGMLIDTSRNGWGGSARPTGPSTSTVMDTFVNESRIDRRIHAGNWCNQSGAGMGERPKAAPASGIDAYVWVKPPGESDGSSSLIPNDEGKGFDQMCDPSYGGNARNGNSSTGALDGAPISGAWFSAQFRELMANAYPAL